MDALRVPTSTALVAAAPTLFRQGLLALLHEQWPQLTLLLTTEASQVVALVARHAFKLVLLDATLPGRALPELLRQLHRIRPTQRLVVLAGPRTLAPRRSGLPQFETQLLVPGQVLPQALAAALAPWLDEPAALTAEAALPPPTLRTQPLTSGFSARELEVLRLVVADCCNEEIAERLCLSVRTVESHRRALLQKAGTRTLVGLAAKAVREGWAA